MTKPIGKLVRKAATQVARRMDHFAQQYGLTGLQMSVIDFIAHQPDYRTSQRAIEQEFGIQRSTTTVMLQRMEKHNLVTRQPAQQDRRQREVLLTPKATQLVSIVRDFITNDDQELRQYFTAAELASVTKLLTCMIEREGTR